MCLSAHTADPCCSQHATDTGGGAAWSLAARPSARQLAVGCEDGGIRLYDVSDVGISYSASFTRTDGVLPLRTRAARRLR